jgi:8-amino-7-oxononanoate synthase
MFDAVIDEVAGRRIRIGRRWLIDFASCNYLGFDLAEETIESIDKQVRRWGTHPSWSRLLGSPRLYTAIEERLTELLGAEDTLVLSTISLIHMSVPAALARRGTIFVDRQAHKTMYDGAVYARCMGATLVRFDLSDVDQLADGLKAAARRGPMLVGIDGVNSMTGNIADVAALATLCREHGATLYVDDAHGFGLIGERRPDESSPYGARGNSIVRHAGESYDNIILVGGFSKAYSSLAAFLAVPTDVKNYLKVAAPPYLYSGPSPTASLATVLAGFDLNETRGDALRADVYRMSTRVLAHVRALGLATPNTANTPLIELPLANADDLEAVAETLWQRGIYVTLAPYPLVPRHQVGFRVQITAAHNDTQIDELNAVISDLADKGILARSTPAYWSEFSYPAERP